MIELLWKDFLINLNVHYDYFKKTYPNSFNGFVCDEGSAKFIVNGTPTEELINGVNLYWNSINDLDETNYRLEQEKIKKIRLWAVFGTDVNYEIFSTFEDYSPSFFQNLSFLLKNGLLNHALIELQAIINSTNDSRFIVFFDKIQIFSNS